MGNSLRLCVACILPFGALDVVRVVHIDGQVKEYGRRITAGEILAANPHHVISKPCFEAGDLPSHRIIIVSPDDDLKRGHIYFLIPAASLPVERKKKKRRQKKLTAEKNSGFPRRQTERVARWLPQLERISEDI